MGFISMKSCEYWSKLALEVKYMIAAWKKRDKARYKKPFGERLVGFLFAFCPPAAEFRQLVQCAQCQHFGGVEQQQRVQRQQGRASASVDHSIEVGHRPKAMYHHQRKAFPSPAIHSGDKYRIADTGHCPQAWPRLYTARRFFDMTDFEKVYNFENLYRAYRKARRGKRWKGAAAKFEVNLLEALNLLSVQLQSHTYRLSPYNTFKVYEPKNGL